MKNFRINNRITGKELASYRGDRPLVEYVVDYIMRKTKHISNINNKEEREKIKDKYSLYHEDEVFIEVPNLNITGKVL